MSEIWKDIHFWENGIEYNFCGLYQVSSYGRVKSFHNGKEKILKVGNTDGYERVTLFKNGKQKKFLIHRLVAHMFLANDNPIEKIEVNHIDENKENNHAENLEWCTKKYNINFGTRNERVSEKVSETIKGEKHPRAKLIDRFTLDGEYLDTYYAFDYYQLFEFNQGNMVSCCQWYACGENKEEWYKTHKNKPYKSTGGFIFKYHEEKEWKILKNKSIKG